MHRGQPAVRLRLSVSRILEASFEAAGFYKLEFAALSAVFEERQNGVGESRSWHAVVAGSPRIENFG